VTVLFIKSYETAKDGIKLDSSMNSQTCGNSNKVENRRGELPLLTALREHKPALKYSHRSEFNTTKKLNLVAD
jgi:hypothetical protein